MKAKTTSDKLSGHPVVSPEVLLVGAYNLLDLAPKGRNEVPEAPMSWVRHHDRYNPPDNVSAATH